MTKSLACSLIAAVLALAACSNAEDGSKAPAGAMEGFADKHAADQAGDQADRVEAARARETARAADARQKVEAAEGMERFDRAEREIDERDANKAQ